VSVSAIVKRKVKCDLAEQHFQAARFFADCASKLESEPCVADPEGQIKKSHHYAYVVGAISSAVMGLEAYINQIYLDACDRDYNKLGGLDETAIALLAEWWPRLEASHADTLLKYQHALLVASKTALPKGETPYQDAESLILLRNVLTHYKPEWDDAPRQHGKVRSRLEDRFSCNALYPDAYLWFPHRCLGAGCARWAVGAAEEFVHGFCTRFGIPWRI
jgi:hypothetical protein